MKVYGIKTIQHLTGMRFQSISILSSSLLVGFLWILLLLYFFPDPETARHFALENKCTSFAIAEEMARDDFAKGKFTILLTLGNNIEGGLKRNDLLKQKYNVEVLFPRCVTSFEFYHYSDVMTKLLYEKYGEEFIKLARPNFVRPWRP